jgi:hypothetical protein
MAGTGTTSTGAASSDRIQLSAAPRTASSLRVQFGPSPLSHALGHKVEEKFTKLSGEPRDARENRGIGPVFGRIFIEIVLKTQNTILPKFQILVSESKFEFPLI